jgi:hypothetical protein
MTQLLETCLGLGCGEASSAACRSPLTTDYPSFFFPEPTPDTSVLVGV